MTNSTRPEGRRTKVLFVCVGNSCRSQMAEALARHLAPDLIEAESAGLAPFRQVSAPTLAVLEERGIRARAPYSKGLEDVTGFFTPELVVNLSGRKLPEIFPGVKTIHWEVEDPFGADVDCYRAICDEIEERVKKLAAELRKDCQ